MCSAEHVIFSLQVYINVPNGTLHMRSKEEDLNFTVFETLDCFRYIEENDTIEESFFKSNSSKFCKLIEISINCISILEN